ncbi:MAG: hypothetical protein V1749_06715, partial [Candidatus Desantisbacteria bacterium]
ANEEIIYQCIAIWDNTVEIDITDSATMTPSNGGSFTQNSFLTKYVGTWTIQAGYAGFIGTASITILPGIPTTMLYASGNNQVGNCASTLKEPFSVKAVDKYGNPCEGVVVNWKVVVMPSGSVTGHSIYPTSTTTNIFGIATSSLTLGTEPPGTYTVQAIMPGLIDSSYVFTAYSLRRIGNMAGFCLLDLGAGKSGTSSQIQVTIIPTGATITTNGSSYFIFENIPVGSYTLNFDSYGASSRVVSNVCISQTQFEDTTYTGTISLLAGDATHDGRINLEEWPVIVDSFFTQKGSQNWDESKEADFNHDGRVDDDDFIIFRNNFGRQAEGTVIMQKSPFMANRAKTMSGNIELSFNLDTLEGVDKNNSTCAIRNRESIA